MCVCVCVFIDKAMGNGACPPADQSTLNSETDLNLEVSFAEQALSYRERSKGVESQSQSESEADDKLPVRAIKH